MNTRPVIRYPDEQGALVAASPSRAGYSLLEMLVYISVVAVLSGIGFSALYRCMTHSTALRRNTADIVDAVHAGENWRVDVRAAATAVRLDTDGDEQVLHLAAPDRDVSYRVGHHTLSRRLGTNDWSTVLTNVAASSFVAEQRQGVSVWRWELELQVGAKKITRVRPLFTFIAVPGGSIAK